MNKKFHLSCRYDSPDPVFDTYYFEGRDPDSDLSVSYFWEHNKPNKKELDKLEIDNVIYEDKSNTPGYNYFVELI